MRALMSEKRRPGLEQRLEPFPIPLNTLMVRDGSGMMSYPNYIDPYRALQFLDLHLLYRACSAAEVECRHVYMHRNPYSVIRSTVVKRRIWPLTSQVVLLSTMLEVLRSQLTDFPHNLVACFDFDESYDTRDNMLLMNILGITEGTFIRLFNGGNLASNLDLLSVVEPRAQVYMDTLVDLSNKTMSFARLSNQGLEHYSNSSNFRTEDDPKEKRESTPDVVFVFFAGIEGTGHGFLESMYRNASRDYSFLKQHGLRQSVMDIETLLYRNGQEEHGLFSSSASSVRPKQRKRNATQLFNKLVGSLRKTHHDVLNVLLEEGTLPQVKPFPVPLNTLILGNDTGPMSYPNYVLPYRALQFPDVHMIYRACVAAEVQCGHVYMHRNPYNVIRSTVQKRKVWPLQAQIALLSSMLQVLQSQLTDFPHNILACFDFEEYQDTSRNDNMLLVNLLGIVETNYTKLFDGGKPPPFVDRRVQVYMDTLVDISNSTMELCKHTLLSGRGWFLP